MEEVVPLGDDRQSLACKQPVASGGTVRILVNDEFFIPQGGLYTPAVLYSSQSGPYDILENENALTVTSPAGQQTFTLPVRRVSAKGLRDWLVAQGLTVAEVSADNGHLVFAETTKVGAGSFVKVSGTAATAMGFGSPDNSGRQWMARGAMLYPPWRLYTRQDSITNRYPRFVQPIKNKPVFKLTYTVPPQRCLRCGGVGYENDYRFDSSGQCLLIANEDLLYQAALKILLTDRGSNPYYPWYGTDLRSRIGTKAISGVASLINEDVRRALVRYQALQEEQARYQEVSFGERLYSILKVQVKPHVQDPTAFEVEVSVQSASSEPINLTIVFAVPGAVALMGSNGLFLNSQ